MPDELNEAMRNFMIAQGTAQVESFRAILAEIAAFRKTIAGLIEVEEKLIAAVEVSMRAVEEIAMKGK